MSGEKKVFVVNGVSVRLYAPADLSKKWFYEWYDAGKRCRKHGTMNRQPTLIGRQAAAAQLMDELKLSLLPGKSIEQVRVEEYVESMAGQWRNSTMVNVRGIVSRLFDWLDGRQVTRENMEAFFSMLKAQRHSTTYNVYRMWLSQIFKALNNPTLFINIPILKTTKTPARYFQPHQIQKLRTVIQKEDPQLWLYVQFVFYCFIRPSRELPHIKAGNIMMDDREILIWAERSKNKRTQYVTIPDSFFPDLEFVYDMGPDEYLFPGTYDKSKPIGRNTMSNRHRQILKRLNFGRGYCLYSWKHTGAIQAIKAGISVKELQLQLRHHSLEETDRYLRQMGIRDISNFRQQMPDINKITRR